MSQRKINKDETVDGESFRTVFFGFGSNRHVIVVYNNAHFRHESYLDSAFVMKFDYRETVNRQSAAARMDPKVHQGVKWLTYLLLIILGPIYVWHGEKFLGQEKCWRNSSAVDWNTDRMNRSTIIRAGNGWYCTKVWSVYKVDSHKVFWTEGYGLTHKCPGGSWEMQTVSERAPI